MGKARKPFIDKKTASTFSLTFNRVDSDDEGEEEQAIEDGEQCDDGFFPRGQGNLDGYVLSEERRQENVKYGYPNDGYDYLRHLRSAGHGGAQPSAGVSVPSAATHSQAGPSSRRTGGDADSEGGDNGSDDDSAAVAGPSVFIPSSMVQRAADDVKLVDARNLTVQGQVDNEEKALMLSAAVTAFTKDAKHNAIGKGKLLNELRAIEQMMLNLEENADLEEDGGQGHEGDWGDWMDTFVVAAAKAEAKPTGDAADEEEEEEDGGGESGDEFEEGEEDDEVPGMPERGPLPAGITPSLASSYWRNERKDRRGELGTVDDCFENVAAQYDEDALGELDDEAAAKARGTADISNFTSVLDEFLREQQEADGLVLGAAHGPHEPGFGEGSDMDEEEEEDDGFGAARLKPTRGSKKATSGSVPHNKAQTLEQIDLEVIALTKARLAVEEARSAATDANPEGSSSYKLEPKKVVDEDEDRDKFDIGPEWFEATGHIMVPQDDKWDCESVLSLRSNLENHPARIIEPQGRTGSKGGGTIKLSSKSGLPTGYTPGPSDHKSSTVVEPPPKEGSATAAAIIASLTAATAGLSTSHHSEGEKLEEGNNEEEEGDGDEDDGDEHASIYVRRKGETAEEKRVRKAAVKSERREARCTKKMVKTLFKEEGGRQAKQAAGKSAAAPGLSTFVIP